MSTGCTIHAPALAGTVPFNNSAKEHRVMPKSKKSTEFRESDRTKYWYVDGLDPNRPMRRTCSRDRWIGMVNTLIERDAQGQLIHREPWLESDDGLLIIRVGTPEWHTFLRKFIYSTGYRMCWEPKPPREPRRPEPSLFADEDAAEPVNAAAAPQPKPHIGTSLRNGCRYRSPTDAFS